MVKGRYLSHAPQRSLVPNLGHVSVLLLCRQVVLQYLLNRTWTVGFISDVAGALLMPAALSGAPVSVVQPVAGSGLAILAVFSHFYLGVGDHPCSVLPLLSGGR